VAEAPKTGKLSWPGMTIPVPFKRIKVVEGKNGKGVYICWENGSKCRVKFKGDGYEIRYYLWRLNGNRGKNKIIGRILTKTS